MERSAQIAQEISVLMPAIARRVLLGFFQSVDITQTQLFTIIILFEKESCRFSELSQALGIAAPTVTGIVDRLERDGYVKRVPDKEDRRAVNVVLTSKGVNIAKKLRQTLQDHWQAILEKLTLTDCEDYLRILKKIKGNL